VEERNEMLAAGATEEEIEREEHRRLLRYLQAERDYTEETGPTRATARRTGGPPAAPRSPGASTVRYPSPRRSLARSERALSDIAASHAASQRSHRSLSDHGDDPGGSPGGSPRGGPGGSRGGGSGGGGPGGRGPGGGGEPTDHSAVRR
jgi:hypothetical protein